MANTATRQPASDVPAGYEPVQTLADAYAGLVCQTCGAVVSRNTAQVHSEWHQRLWDRLGIS